MEKHSGFRENYREKSEKEVRKGIKSFRERIKVHEGYIREPEKFYPEFNELDKRERENLRNVKWKNDIKRLKEQLEILEELLAGKR